MMHLRGARRTGNRLTPIKIARDEEILAGPYPKSLGQFVGQDEARRTILSEIKAALAFGRPVRHTLLASGLPGIGKTALARLMAYTMAAGFVELGGTSIKEDEVVNALKQMKDGDVLFIDEVHRLMSGGRSKMEWLLTLLQDGLIQTPKGPFFAPKITVIAATTDPEKLPQAVLDRFGCKPQLDEYSIGQAAQVAGLKAKSIGFGSTLPSGIELPALGEENLRQVAKATNCNPRRIGMLLETIASTYFDDNGIYTDSYDLTPALEREGLTADGLTREQVAYLVKLYDHGEALAEKQLQRAISVADLTHTERLLIKRGYVEVTNKGRALTEWGETRALPLYEEALAVQEQELQVAA